MDVCDAHPSARAVVEYMNPKGGSLTLCGHCDQTEFGYALRDLDWNPVSLESAPKEGSCERVI